LSEDFKSRVKLPEGFSFLREGDVAQPFRTGDKTMDKYVLRDYYAWSLLPDELVVLHQVAGGIAGIIEMTVNENHMMVEMVARNTLVAASGVGTRLMSVAENVARQLGKDEIRLESLDGVVAWYDGPLGYEEYTDRFYDPEFGWLTPKRKFMR
jgi:hypothetical protein